MPENRHAVGITRTLELVKLAVAVIGGLAGLAAAFSFVGLAIAFGLVYGLGVHGLLSSVAVFCIDSTIAFYRDLFDTICGRSVLIFLASLLASSTLVCLYKLMKTRDR